MIRLLVLPFAAVVLAAGCGGDSGPPSFAMKLPGSPTEVRDRAPLPFCGEEDVLLGEAGTDERARRCFAERWRDGLPAEFVSTRRTAEGEPITMVFRSLSAERLEIFVDNSRTIYGGRRGWLVRTCREYVPAMLSYRRCGPPTPL